MIIFRGGVVVYILSLGCVLAITIISKREREKHFTSVSQPDWADWMEHSTPNSYMFATAVCRKTSLPKGSWHANALWPTSPTKVSIINVTPSCDPTCRGTVQSSHTSTMHKAACQKVPSTRGQHKAAHQSSSSVTDLFNTSVIYTAIKLPGEDKASCTSKKQCGKYVYACCAVTTV